MGLYIGNTKYTIAKVNYRGFWLVTVYGITGTVVTCGTSKTIDETGSVSFKFVEAGTYTFTATRGTETQTQSVVLSDTTGVYFHEIYMYVLPTGYTRLQYIDSSGTEYIDTGITGNLNTEISGSFANLYNGSEVLHHLCGTNNPNTKAITIQAAMSSNATSRFGDKTLTRQLATDNNLHTFITNKTQLTVDNEVKGAFNTTTSFTTETNLLVFGAYTTSGVSCGASRCAWMKIKNNSTLVRNFIPVKNASNEAGLYDTVTDAFFGNAGTGDFTPGPIV